jgi:hypothetical protein
MSSRPFPDYFWMAAGFVSIPQSLTMPSWVKTKDNFCFGLCLFPPNSGKPPQLLEPLTVGDLKFPVISLPAEYIRHQPAGGPPDPHGAKNGTAACWAQPDPLGSNPTGLPGAGILTAAHVAIDATPVVPMTPGTPYAVVGYAIDAAVLHPEPLPTSATPLPVSSAAAVGSHVDVFPSSVATATATILLTFQPSTYVGYLCPHRMIIDVSFSPGDSGALVKDQTTQDAVGLYIGEIVTPGGTTRGACQIMEQVVTEFAIKLYL